MQDQTTRLQQKGIKASFLGTIQKDSSSMESLIRSSSLWSISLLVEK